VDFREWLSFRTKRFVAISLVVLGVFSAGLFFLPLTVRFLYAVVFIALTMIPIYSMVQMVTGSVITQAQILLYNRKYNPRIEIWPEVKAITKKLGIEHPGEVYVSNNLHIPSPFVNLYTKKITVPESWLAQFHRTEIIATLGHELGHIKGQKKFTREMFLVMFGSIGFTICFSFVAALLGLFVIPIFVQLTTFTLMMLLLSFVLWRNEYAADMYGALATSPEALIAVFEGLQGMRKKGNKKDQGSETHPPLYSRIDRLKPLLG
jgi:Zn-dependent protease with chaperone function